MSYNGSGTFNINTTGQPVVAGTVISSSAFNALTTDLATGLTTAITKDGQTTTTARITFAQGITSSLVTDSSSVSTGSIITAGGAGIAKNLYVGGIASFSAQPIFTSLTASSAVATDASKGLVSVTNTGTGNNVLATSPTITTPVISSIVNTGTLTLPTSTDTLVGRATTDTLTNKTLTSPVISTISNTGTLTLPTSTDTLVGKATTDTLTNKTLTSPTISGAVVSSMNSSVITSGTAVASTSGTSIDFTSLPTWVKRITVMLSGVSTNGTSVPLLRLGTSGGIEATGYLGSTSNIVNGSTPTATNTTGLGLAQAIDAGALYYGHIFITLLTSNTWVMSATLSRSDIALTTLATSSKSLSGTLDRVRITTTNGTDTFDAGTINILYE